jgi:hypothetical protein
VSVKTVSVLVLVPSPPPPTVEEDVGSADQLAQVSYLLALANRGEIDFVFAEAAVEVLTMLFQPLGAVPASRSAAPVPKVVLLWEEEAENAETAKEPEPEVEVLKGRPPSLERVDSEVATDDFEQKPSKP